MKKLLLLFISIVLVLTFTACNVETRQDKALNSLGKYDSKQFWSHGVFQDYTDFGIYTYSSINLDENPYFETIAFLIFPSESK